jgi:hypothetical protein
MLKIMALIESCLDLVGLQFQEGFKTKVRGGCIYIGTFIKSHAYRIISLMQISRPAVQ